MVAGGLSTWSALEVVLLRVQVSLEGQWWYPVVWQKDIRYHLKSSADPVQSHTSYGCLRLVYCSDFYAVLGAVHNDLAYSRIVTELAGNFSGQPWASSIK